MNIKKFIFRLFFPNHKKRSYRKYTQKPSAETESPAIRSNGDATAHKGNYDTSLLRQQVSETEYISNLRIGRSWILPQMVEMGFKKRGSSTAFSTIQFEAAIRNVFDVSPRGRRNVWTLLKRNYKVIADSNGASERRRWWTKEVLKDMLDWDFTLAGRRERGLDRSKCVRILYKTDELSDPKDIYKAIKQYDTYRMRTRKVNGQAEPLPQSFINAYVGDGAYNAMMTMVKVLDIRFKDRFGRLMSRENCIRKINEMAEKSNGHKLLEFCKETFFDSGAFEYEKYINK